ncbi:peptide-N-glycosidase F-related protein [Marinilabiliaceae bacterium ANBcel2]|nr:peptide-N-glycosidase F-related protein [Marinilabiliaceae bacterium ANBcel2]
MNFTTFITLFLLIIFYGCSSSDDTPEKNGSSDDTPEKNDKHTYTISTFQEEHHAFGEGFSQRIEKEFHFPTDPTKVEKILMFVKLRCPEQSGCNAWDVFANVKVKDPKRNKWFEIGRYITPYGVDNSQLSRGFMIDVTDFKEILTGDVNLMSFIEVWGNDGWLVSIDFDVIEGTPDYKYISVAPILDYTTNSLEGVPYGVEHDFELKKNITMPDEAEKSALRTIITGWGHATPVDPDGRPCAEWCFRSHNILINNKTQFVHNMDAMGCDDNPVQPQYGNWEPDRAGWCPGMEVPIRKDYFTKDISGESFTFEYQFEEWSNNFQSEADNPNAYYAISTYIVVKSNSPIDMPLVE